MAAASHFAVLVLGRAVDKGLFCGDKPFSGTELTAQADAGVAAFPAAYGRGQRTVSPSQAEPA